MYIPTTVLIVVLLACIAYSVYKNHKTATLVDDLTRSYDQVVYHLVSYYLHEYGKDPKKRDEALELCAKAILDAAGKSVTTKSLLSTTDILSMCQIFQRNFKIREKLTPPDYEFSEGYDKELESIKKAIIEDLKAEFKA